MDAAFKLAASPECRFKVLGFKLHPLTLGHLFLLERHEIQFLGDEPPTFGDLALAVFICCQPWRQSEKAIRAWWFNRFGRLWAWWKCKADFIAEASAFAKYLQQQLRPPAFNRTSTTQIPPGGSPRHYSLLASLMSQFRMAKAEAMDMTVLEAQALLVCVGEMRGSMQLRTDGQRSHWEAVRGEARN